MSVESRTHPVLAGTDAFAANMADVILLIGRIMLGWIFVRSGYGKIFDIAAYGATFPARGMPAWLAYIAVPAEFFGGVALILGLATRYVVVVMLVFMVVATFSTHHYWTFTDVAQRRNQDTSFYKNVAMTGGFLFLFVTGAGRLSFDAWLARRPNGRGSHERQQPANS